MTFYDKISHLKGKIGTSHHAHLAIAQIEFAARMSTAKDNRFDKTIEEAVDFLCDFEKENGAITKDAAKKAEDILLPLSEEAKKYEVHCVAHSHIDMNWMWGYQETVCITIETFRTILDLMKEYPDFTYSQSQASTYEIIEKYAPQMLPEIKKYIKEGRWEVTASTWVETDKNMPNGESLARHILYTKRYLSKLLDIDASSLNLDFEPDTFGHNISTPEICNKGGVKYYYHCRGNSNDADRSAYRWKGRSCAELIVWREPTWYINSTEYFNFSYVPALCAQNKIDCALFVYGVGDHGGGPSRRDIERLIEISKLPVMPTFKFSTYNAFFKKLETFKDKFPVREGELNYIFTGCYTSQSRIKMSNRLSEDKIYESEMLGAFANISAGGAKLNGSFETAWKKILFNHFHDILPGSGKIETREYALGSFQDAMAAIWANSNESMRKLADSIDTSSIPTDFDKESTSEGAGVGMIAERGMGRKRIFHLFNTTEYDFEGVTKVKIWDWNCDPNRAIIKDSEGNEVPKTLVQCDAGYWGHTFKEYAIMAKVPAFGYSTYTVDELPIVTNNTTFSFLDRQDVFSDENISLENNLIRAVFDHKTAMLISLVDKNSGKEMLTRPSAYLRLIHEDTVRGMTSWRVGTYMSEENLNETKDVTIYAHNPHGLRKNLAYRMKYGERSSVIVEIVLNENSNTLEYNIQTDFLETGSHEKGVPQLSFHMPIGYASKKYRYDVPFGTIDRGELFHDVPANSFAVALPEGEANNAVMVVSESKYGFRSCSNSISVDLIRGSFDPDPYPELFTHNIRLGVCLLSDLENKTMYKTAAEFVHPILFCSARPSKEILKKRGLTDVKDGTLPLCGKLFEVSGNVHVSAVKTPEDTDGIVIRLSDECGKGSAYTLTFSNVVKEAYITDINENIVTALKVERGKVNSAVSPYEVQTVLVKL